MSKGIAEQKWGMKKFRVITVTVVGIICIVSLVYAAVPSRVVLTDSEGHEYYLWIDTDGNMRLKEGMPASDKDGSRIVKEERSGIVSTRFTQSLTLILLVVFIIVFSLILYSTKKK